MKNSVFLLVFLIGLFAPTSRGATIYYYLPVFYASIMIPIFIFVILKDAKVPKYNAIIAILINLILWGATIFTPLTSYSVGNSLFYALFSLLICLNLKDNTPLSNNKRLIVNVVHVFILTCCLLIMMQNITIVDFFINNYSLYYDEMMIFALAMKKPVVMFAAHSIAGFFLYLMFYMCFTLYKKEGKWLHLVFSLLYVWFIFNLSSNGGYIFFTVATIQLLYYFLKYKTIKFFWLISIVMISSLFILDEVINFVEPYLSIVSRTLSSDQNGISGRYSSEGILSGNIDFIKDNVFMPVGFGNSPDLFFGDAGIIEYTLRGSIPLVILMYLGLYLFLKRNLYSKYAVMTLSIAIIIMDIGAQTLISFRTLCILPFLVIYLNDIHNRNVQKKEKPKKVKRKFIIS
ncbi:hypothetical protein CN425_17570 [Bacillus cereus]|uniref:Polysaccharide polymerase n=1 Tax=Bacillus cereus TaxID=1396 RepID=A0A2A8PU12_BACCE|nr:hypothetical protein [Bacillus cereus]PEW00290.1 hypothetical protein CN425_17570 [Bacillus cereus]